MTEHFRDGRRECRVAVEDGRNTLLHQPFELPSEDADEFTTTEISAEEFERRWTKPF